MEPHKTLKQIVREGVDALVLENNGRGVKMQTILSRICPVGYERDYRDCVVEETRVAEWTSFGDPLRVTS
jgi:hypothetical protein